MNELFYHQQFLLRLPPKIAEQVTNILNSNKNNENGVHVEVNPQGPFSLFLTLSFSVSLFLSFSLIVYSLIDKAKFEFVFGDQRFPALLGNLPCNIETHKTFDHMTYYKSGDVSQVIFHTSS